MSMRLITNLILLAFAGILGASDVVADTITLQKIADSNTTFTTASGSTVSIGDIWVRSAVIDEGQVAFANTALSGRQAVYLFDGTQVNEVAAVGGEATGFPDGSTFKDFEDIYPSIEVEAGVATVAFDAEVNNIPGESNAEAIFTSTGGELTYEYDTRDTDVPSGGAPFQDFETLVLSEGNLAFMGGRSGISGIYTDAATPGELTKVLDTTDEVVLPGLSGTYRFLAFLDDEDFSFSGNTIGFRAFVQGDSGQARVLVKATPDGSYTVMANSLTTTNPNTGLLFNSNLTGPRVDGDNFVFYGRDSQGNEGLFADFGDGLFTIVDDTTILPGQDADSSTLLFTDSHAISGDRVVFLAQSDTGRGIYLWDDGMLFRVIDTTQTLDGMELSNVSLGLDGAFTGNEIVFVASLNDGSFGNRTEVVYVATIPEPSSLALLGLGGLGLLTRRRGRRDMSDRNRNCSTND